MNARCTAALLCLLAGLWSGPLTAQQACPKPLGILDSLLVQGTRLAAIDAGQFLVERNGHSIAMNIGDPLCENDRMATRPDVTAKLMVGRADGKRHELTMLPGATLVLRAVNRVELALGRLIAAVNGQFDVVLPLARLAATGTVFEVEAGSHDASVEQLEGETQLTPAGAPTAVLNPLTRVASVASDGAAVTPVDQATCKGLVGNANRIDIAALPPVRSRNAIPQVTPAAAPSAYDTARQNAICGGDGQARELVGRILADWERPQQALEELRSGSAAVAATEAIAAGKALLMRGEPQRALNEFERASAAGGDAVEVAAGKGDARRDLGLQAIRSNQLPVAATRFDEARAQYVEAARRAATDETRGILLVNLGDLALLRIRLDAESVEVRMTEAEALYRRAREQGDPPHARLGLARLSMLRALRIPTQQVDATGLNFGEILLMNLALDAEAKRLRRPHWQQARSDLNELLAAVPAFSPAQELLGEVQKALGDTGAAEKLFRQAIAADPGNTSAYGALAQTLSGGRRAMYEGAYQAVEVPAVREIDATERSILAPVSETVTIAPALLTPDLPRYNFARSGENHVFILTNRSASPVTVASSTITGAGADAFRIRSNGCASAAVAPNAECRIDVVFVTGRPGRHRASLELTFTGASIARQIELRGEVPEQSGGEGDGRIL